MRKRVSGARKESEQITTAELNPSCKIDAAVPNELDIVRDVSLRLEQGGLAYRLTGSMAMNYYAQPRMTRDIDLPKSSKVILLVSYRCLCSPFKALCPSGGLPREGSNSFTAVSGGLRERLGRGRPRRRDSLRGR